MASNSVVMTLCCSLHSARVSARRAKARWASASACGSRCGGLLDGPVCRRPSRRSSGHPHRHEKTTHSRGLVHPARTVLGAHLLFARGHCSTGLQTILGIVHPAKVSHAF